MTKTLTMARKELRILLSSATALVFVGAFLLLTLFVFFWVDAFWARGLADVRPLFNRMPLLLLVLVSALTMRQWSEEQRSGTQEILLTLPVRRIELVLGKLLAVIALVALTLALTLFLPVSISFLGDLDWGPVWGGYLAALLLAAAYGAIGLFISSRTDNQIVAFIVTLLVCGALYLLGTSDLSSAAGASVGAVLRALSTSSRFESIQRGVIDLRDLVYYLSLTAIFVTANVLSLQAKGWSTRPERRAHRHQSYALASLVMANLVLLNIWLAPLRGLRWDLTEQHVFTLSDATQNLLSQLQEPLEITAYLSSETHPLLEPLAPEIEDLLHEYAVAGGSRVHVSVIDPADDPEAEAEANNTYGIRPNAFQVAGRNQTSIINAYLDVLVRYGDQSEVLGFGDLVKVTANRDGTVEVALNNLEYQLTSAIKRAVYGFQSVEAALAAMTEPAKLTLYLTSSTLPAWLADAPAAIQAVVDDYTAASPNLSYAVVDLDDQATTVTPQELYEQYGLQPVRASLTSTDTYYFYLVLTVGDQSQVIYPGGTYAESDVRKAVDAAIKRSAPGFLKVVGVWTPPAPQGSQAANYNLATYEEARQALADEYQVSTVDLSTGAVPAEIDVLVLIAPQNLSERERFAIDQYLMRGGSVVAVAGNYGLTIDPYSGSLALQEIQGGLRDLLLKYGIDVQKALVLDPQNEPFPVIVNRQVSGFTVQELQAMDYPFFIDVRQDGLAADSPITAGLSAVTLNWASPVVVDAAANANRQVETLVRSSSQSWLQTDTNINPDFSTYPDYGFAVVAPQQSYPLGVAVTGTFTSAYAESGVPASDDGTTPDTALLTESPATAHLIVLGSAEFLNDTVFAISSQLAVDRHMNSIQLIQNAVAWCVEEPDMLAIRTKGNATMRVLASLSEQGQKVWEWGNYAVALVALLVLGGWWRSRLRHERPLPLTSPGQSSPAAQDPVGGPRS
ncbi:MAG: Gldg family protein [Anaerolineales bacterium]